MKNSDKFTFIFFMLLATTQIQAVSSKYIKEVKFLKTSINSTFTMATKEDIPPDKAWTLKFTEPIDNSSIYIQDVKRNTINTNFKFQKNIVTIPPISSCSPYKYYRLYIIINVSSYLGRKSAPFDLKSWFFPLLVENLNFSINKTSLLHKIIANIF